MSERDQFEAWWSSYADVKMITVKSKRASRGGYFDEFIDRAWHAWQASGQALKAEQEGAWIACSERMPEDGGRYWCYVEEQNSLGKSHYQWNCSWNGDDWGGEGFIGRVTHWMPLPTPPSQPHPIDTTSQ